LKANSTAKKADAVAKEERKQKWSAANAGPNYMWYVDRFHSIDHKSKAHLCVKVLSRDGLRRIEASQTSTDSINIR